MRLIPAEQTMSNINLHFIRNRDPRNRYDSPALFTAKLCLSCRNCFKLAVFSVLQEKNEETKKQKKEENGDGEVEEEEIEEEIEEEEEVDGDGEEDDDDDDIPEGEEDLEEGEGKRLVHLYQQTIR